MESLERRRPRVAHRAQSANALGNGRWLSVTAAAVVAISILIGYLALIWSVPTS